MIDEKYIAEKYMTDHPVAGFKKVTHAKFKEYYNLKSGNKVSIGLYLHMYKLIEQRLWFYMSEWDYVVYFDKMGRIFPLKHKGKIFVGHRIRGLFRCYKGLLPLKNGDDILWKMGEFLNNVTRRQTDINLKDPVPHNLR